MILEINVEDKIEILVFEVLFLNFWKNGNLLTFSELTNNVFRQKCKQKNVKLKNVNFNLFYVTLLKTP